MVLHAQQKYGTKRRTVLVYFELPPLSCFLAPFFTCAKLSRDDFTQSLSDPQCILVVPYEHTRMDFDSATAVGTERVQDAMKRAFIMSPLKLTMTKSSSSAEPRNPQIDPM